MRTPGWRRETRSDELHAAHVRHDDVGQHELDVVAGPLEDGERLPAVPRLEDGVALLGQHPGGERPDRVLVLHQQDRLGAADGSGRRRGTPSPAASSACARGKQSLKLAPSAGARVHPDVPAALHHDAVHGGEAEAGIERRGLGGEERLEQVRLHLGLMPCPVSLTISST